MSWEEASGAFERHLRVERNVSPNTLRAYLADWRGFATFALEQSLEQPSAVSKRDVRHWVATLHSERSAATIARKLSAVRAGYRFLLREGQAVVDPTAGVPAPRNARRLPRPLAVDDCEVLAAGDVPRRSDIAIQMYPPENLLVSWAQATSLNSLSMEMTLPNKTASK